MTEHYGSRGPSGRVETIGRTPLHHRGPVRLRLRGCSSGSTCRPADAREVAGCLIEGGAPRRRFARHGAAAGVRRRVQAGVVKARPGIRVHRVGSRRGARRRRQRARAGGRRARDGRRDRSGARAWHRVRRRPEQQSLRAGGVLRREGRRAGAASALAISNAPPNMAPFGGKTRFLGTNPLAIGMPAGAEPPLIFDASTSVVARGKIIVAAHSEAADSRRVGGRSGRLSDDRCRSGAGRRGAAVRRPEGIGDFVHHRYLLRRADRRGVRVAPEHARGSWRRAERRPRVRGGRTDLFLPDAEFRVANGRDPGDAQERRRRPPGCRARAGARRDRARARTRTIGSRGSRSRRRSRRSSPRLGAERGRGVSSPAGGVARLGVGSRMTLDAAQNLQFPAAADRLHFGCGSRRLAAGSRARPRRPSSRSSSPTRASARPASSTG